LEAILSLPKRYQWLLPMLKTAVVLLLLVALYVQVFARAEVGAIFAVFQAELQWSRLPWLLAALALVPANWALETLKWREFTQAFSRRSFGQSFRAVLAGVTLALFTPNRIGEYGGRILLSERRHGWRIAVATLLGSYSQMIVLVSCGLVGFSWFAYNQLGWQVYHLYGVTAVGLAVIITLIFGFFSIQNVIPVIRKIASENVWRRIRRQIVMLRACTPRQRWRSLGWAMARYTTYSTQYWLMLAFMGVDAPFGAALAGIATIFLVQTGIPLPLAGSLLARAEIALFVWGTFDANELSILAATFGLFIINLALPALLGAVFIVKINEPKTINYEKNAIERESLRRSADGSHGV
jgi:hypothetical protein